MFYDAALDRWVPVKSIDQSLGEGFTDNTIHNLSLAVAGLKNGLAGEGAIRRFGNEGKILQMAHDAAAEATRKAGDPDILSALEIETPEKFAQDYKARIAEYQTAENALRAKDGKSAIEGFGDYQVTTYRRFFVNPVSTAKALAKESLAAEVRGHLGGFDPGSKYSDISFFTKEEQARYLPRYLREKVYTKYQEISSKLRDPNIDRVVWQALIQDQERLRLVIKQFSKDRKVDDPSKRTGVLAKAQNFVRDELLTKGMISKAFGKIGQVNGEVSKFRRDPIGYTLHAITVRPAKYFFKKYILGETKLFGRWLGLGLSKRFSKWSSEWLKKHLNIGRVFNFGGKFFGAVLKGGPSRLISNLSFQAGKLVGKLLFKIGQFAIKGILSTAVRAAIVAALAALAPIIIPLLLIIGGFVVILVIVILTMTVLTSGSGKVVPLAAADLVIIAVGNPSQNVGPSELVQINVEVLANKDASDVKLTATFDDNFSAGRGGIAGGADCTVVERVAHCPISPAELSADQSLVFTFSAATVPSMTTSTRAVVSFRATSSNVEPGSTAFYLNGAGIPGFDNNIPFGWPTEGTLISNYFGLGTALHSDYGERIDRDSRGTAVDISGNDGKRICSTLNGRVTSTDDGVGGLGPLIYNETSGYLARFHHMKSVAVRIGDIVTKGQFLGIVGSTGNSSGPHLHYAIYTSPGVGPGRDFYQYVPQGYLDQYGRVLNSSVTATLTC